MVRALFSKYVCDQIAYYVYRLIDPRSGETFYVGKGRDNRIFSHVKGEPSIDSDIVSDKIKIIREIRADGFEVGQIIHRHGMDEKTALAVEAALIDAYPGVSNDQAGHGSDDVGVMHYRQIIERYEAPEAVFNHDALLINVNRSVVENTNVYEAVRFAWRLDPRKARKAQLVMAVEKGLIIGVFVARQWLESTQENFPNKDAHPGRWGFIGVEASPDTSSQYIRHRIPSGMRKRGASNPVRYVFRQEK